MKINELAYSWNIVHYVQYGKEHHPLWSCVGDLNLNMSIPNFLTNMWFNWAETVTDWFLHIMLILFKDGGIHTYLLLIVHNGLKG